MKILLVVFALYFGAFSGAAEARQTVHDLAEKCIETDNLNPFSAFCSGYMIAWIDIFHAMEGLNAGFVACLPKGGLSARAFRIMFLDWYRRNPLDRDTSARVGLMLMAIEAFPCEK